MNHKDLMQQIKKLEHTLLKASKDEAFKKELKHNPEAILKKEGIDLFKNLHLKLLENTNKEFNFIIPVEKWPKEMELKTLPENASLFDIERWIVTQIQENTPLKEPLLSNPTNVFKKYDVKLVKDMKIHIHQNSNKVHYLIIPTSAHEDKELSELEMQAVAGGAGSNLGGYYLDLYKSWMKEHPGQSGLSSFWNHMRK